MHRGECYPQRPRRGRSWILSRVVRCEMRGNLVINAMLPRPDVSLSPWNVRAKEGGKETTGEAALRLPSVPFPWFLAVHHQSLAFCARLYDAKNEAPEEEVERNGWKAGKGLPKIALKNSIAILYIDYEPFPIYTKNFIHKNNFGPYLPAHVQI